MTDEDIRVQNMIRVCKADLEGIGLEIIAMTIASKARRSRNATSGCSSAFRPPMQRPSG
jgi:hypothetical protein